MKRYYLAYGSNLYTPQMRYHCPSARLMGTAVIENYKLMFKKSKTGSYLTVEPKQGAEVPVAVWQLTTEGEKTLDHYEGYPSFYIKQNISVEIDNGEDTIEAMFYVMDDKYCQNMQTPTEYYYGGIERGYKSNGMPVEELKTAFERCMAEVN